MIWILSVWLLLLTAGFVILYLRFEVLKMREETNTVLIESIVRESNALMEKAAARSRLARRAGNPGVETGDNR